MAINEFLSKVRPVFSGHGTPIYHEILCDTLRKLLVDRMAPDFADTELRHLREQFFSSLPFVTTRVCHEVPGTLLVYALMRHRHNAFKFYFDMINGWLLPGRRSHVSLIYSADFKLEDVNDDIFTLCEARIHIETKKELEQIKDNLPALETELEMGLASSHHARRILEIKGFSNDEKTAQIQDNIAFLLDHRPQDFDQDILTEMQHVLLISREDFKEARSCRHLSRIIGVHYLFRNSLREAVKKQPEKRHFCLKLFRAKIKDSGGHKTVLSVAIGVNFFRDKEALDKPHLLKAIQQYVPSARPIENSFFANRRGSEPICTMYLELEKENGDPFTSEEITLLRQKLAADLQNRIKHLLHPVFMPRNEEEIIRNILSLSSQIKYLRDIPQVFITFDEQTHTDVFFTIILVRVGRPENRSIQEMFKQSDTCLRYIHDRIQHAGHLRKKYKKEATVFRVKLSKEQFIRADHTIDLNRARQVVIEELFNIIGEIRDYNGGMISKQNEVLKELKGLMSEYDKFHDLTLENFFYTLTPVIMRNVLEPEAMRTLFLLMMTSVEQPIGSEESYNLNVVQDPQFVFVTVKATHRSVRDEIARVLIKLGLHSSQLAIASIPIHEITHLGYIYRSDDNVRRQQFISVVSQALTNWKAKRTGLAVLTKE